MTDALTPERVLPLLRGRFGRQFRYFESCASTQLELSADDAEGTLAVAEHQRAGRGRLGRYWDAPPGLAILVSLVLKPPAQLPQAQLSLIAGIAVARTVESALPVSAALKWPNDVLVSGRKVAGVLAESRDRAVVLGVGLNVNQASADLPLEARLGATSLRALDERVRDRAPLLAELLWQIEIAYDSWTTSGLAAASSELATRDWLFGRKLAVGSVTGVAAGIADDGSLLLRDNEELRRVTSGAVRLCGTPDT